MGTRIACFTPALLRIVIERLPVISVSSNPNQSAGLPLVGQLLCPPCVRWVPHHLREGQQGRSPSTLLPIARSNIAKSRVRLSSCSLPGTDDTRPGRNCGLGRFTESVPRKCGQHSQMRRSLG